MIAKIRVISKIHEISNICEISNILVQKKCRMHIAFCVHKCTRGSTDITGGWVFLVVCCNESFQDLLHFWGGSGYMRSYCCDTTDLRLLSEKFLVLAFMAIAPNNGRLSDSQAFLFS